MSGVQRLSDTSIESLAHLEAGLLVKYGIPNSTSNLEAIMRQTQSVFAEDALVCIAHDASGVVRGFVMILAQDDVWHVRQVGFDYGFQAREKLAMYFELMFYSLINPAVKHGVREIHYGLGSVEAKKSRGCTSSVQHGFVRAIHRSIST